MAINIDQVKRRRETAQPRRPNYHRSKKYHPIFKTLLLALIGILIITGAVIYGNHTQWQTAQSVQKASHKAIAKAKTQPVVNASQVKYERGSNEERNRQFRKYFPKGTKFNHVTQEQINRATMLINDKPMGKLGWHSPEHKFTVHQVQIDRKVNNKHTTTKKD